MKKLVIAWLSVVILCFLAYCARPYYVLDPEDLVKDKIHVGDKYLYSHNWRSANPFNVPIVYNVTVIEIKKVQRRWEYVKFRLDNGVILSNSMEDFKWDIRRLSYKKHLKK